MLGKIITQILSECNINGNLDTTAKLG